MSKRSSNRNSAVWALVFLLWGGMTLVIWLNAEATRSQPLPDRVISDMREAGVPTPAHKENPTTWLTHQVVSYIAAAILMTGGFCATTLLERSTTTERPSPIAIPAQRSEGGKPA